MLLQACTTRAADARAKCTRTAQAARIVTTAGERAAWEADCHIAQIAQAAHGAQSAQATRALHHHCCGAASKRAESMPPRLHAFEPFPARARLMN
jgi:hypothetical protein